MHVVVKGNGHFLLELPYTASLNKILLDCNDKSIFHYAVKDKPEISYLLRCISSLFILSLGKMSDTVNTALITFIMSLFNTDWRGQNDSESLTFSIKGKSGLWLEIQTHDETKQIIFYSQRIYSVASNVHSFTSWFACRKQHSKESKTPRICPRQAPYFSCVALLKVQSIICEVDYK